MTLEIWGVRGREMGPRLRRHEGIKEGFGFVFSLLYPYVLFYFLKWENPEHACTLELAVFVPVCVAHE